MARSRNIKPGFFKSYELADLGPHHQLLFAGLWCLADREGRLEDKPRLIKAELFPYYDFDVNGALTVIARLGHVRRYVADGVHVIEVVNFKKHQSPHHTERASELPAFEAAISLETAPMLDNGGFTVSSRLEDGGNPPDSLIPDSLIPDSLIPEAEPIGSVGASAPKPRATRKCPAEFAITTELIAWAASEAPGVPLGTETAKMRDHTFKNTISDWPGAWRNWMRRAQQDLGFRRAQGGVTSASKHAGFAQKDYRKGIEADGTIA